MPAMRDENQRLNYIDLEEKKRAIDERKVSIKKLQDDSIANGKYYVAASQELLQKSSDIKTKIEGLRKSGDKGAILRSLEDAEQRLADARANSSANKTSKNSTTTQKTGARRGAIGF